MKKYILLVCFFVVLFLLGCQADEVAIATEIPTETLEPLEATFAANRTQNAARDLMIETNNAATATMRVYILTLTTATPTATPTPTETQTLTPTPIDPNVPTPTLGIGSTIINPVDGAVLVYIPEGEFLMGDDNVGHGVNPVHAVYLDAFWMYQMEVTYEQYQRCGEAGGCDLTFTQIYIEDSYLDHPVGGVDWYDAVAYCDWAGGRLPTEAEWEKAARGGLEGAIYPWGNEVPVCDIGADNGAQFWDCHHTHHLIGSLPIGSFAPNGYGLYDMAGNIGEWVADWYSDDYYQNSPYMNPTGPEEGRGRVVRDTAGWVSTVESLHIALRSEFEPQFQIEFLGFRCAFSISQP